MSQKKRAKTEFVFFLNYKFKVFFLQLRDVKKNSRNNNQTQKKTHENHRFGGFLVFFLLEPWHSERKKGFVLARSAMVVDKKCPMVLLFGFYY